MDYYFGAMLKENKVSVLHIDNQVYHLGIEKSEIYLRKKEKATETLLKLYHSNNIKEHSNDLLNTYIRLKQFKLNYIFATAFSLFKPLLKKNLMSNYPIIFLLQFYKISYMCHFEMVNKKLLN